MVYYSGRVRARSVLAGRALLILVLILVTGCDADPDPTPAPPAATATPAPPPVTATPPEVAVVLAAPTLPRPEATPPLPRPPERAAVGYAAPNFSATRLADGARVRLSDLRGKAVWINFWATTCEPCRLEMPVMQTIYEQHQGRLEIIGVSPEGAGTVIPYIKEHGYTWTFVLDEGQRFSGRYRTGALPTHFFIDRDGLITKVTYGELSVTQMNGYLGEILDE